MRRNRQTRPSIGGALNLKKFPRILDYLEAKHKDIAEIINDLGVANSLVPRRGTDGITFLLPSKEYIKEIHTLAESDNPEKAIDIIFSLIIPVLLDETQDWKNSKDIGNILGKKVVVKEVDARSVKLENGAVLVNDSDFKPMNTRKNMAVWKLTGKVDLNAPDFSGAFKRPEKKKIGSFEAQNDKVIREFIAYCELMERQAVSASKSGKIKSVKLNVVCNAANYCRVNSGNLIAAQTLKILEHCISPCYGGVEAAFYILFCFRDGCNLNNAAVVPGLFDTDFLASLIGASATSSALLADVNLPFQTFCALAPRKNNPQLEESISKILQGMRISSSKQIIDLYNVYAGQLSSELVGKLDGNTKLYIDEFRHNCCMMWDNNLKSQYATDAAGLANHYSDFVVNVKALLGPNMIINNGCKSFIVKISEDTQSQLMSDSHVSWMTSFLECCAWSEFRPVSGGDEEDEYSDAKIQLSEKCRMEIKEFLKNYSMEELKSLVK